MLDLILPLECGGCGAPSTRWCDVCAEELTVKRRRAAPGQSARRPRRSGVRVGPLRRCASSSCHRRQRPRPHRPGRATVAALGGGHPPAAQVGHHRRSVDHRPGAHPPRGGAPARRRSRHPDGRRGGRQAPGHRRRPGAAGQGLRSRLGSAWAAPPASATWRAPSCCVAADRPSAHEVLLVDDIVTTGATARESVRALYAAGVRVAAVLTIAHA